MEAVEFIPSGPGSKLRHWPPGTNSKTVRAVFFLCKNGMTRAVRLCWRSTALFLMPAKLGGRPDR
jgi:hypothetical protein